MNEEQKLQRSNKILKIVLSIVLIIGFIVGMCYWNNKIYENGSITGAEQILNTITQQAMKCELINYNYQIGNQTIPISLIDIKCLEKTG